MSIVNAPYTDPRRKEDGEQTTGVAWLPIGIQNLTGWSTGDISYDYTYEVYAGPQYWAGGVSSPVVKTQKSMAQWRVRNALRSVKDEFLALKHAFETQAAEENGGTAVVDPTPGWLDEPMETGPEPQP